MRPGDSQRFHCFLLGCPHPDLCYTRFSMYLKASIKARWRNLPLTRNPIHSPPLTLLRLSTANSANNPLTQPKHTRREILLRILFQIPPHLPRLGKHRNIPSVEYCLPRQIGKRHREPAEVCPHQRIHLHAARRQPARAGPILREWRIRRPKTADIIAFFENHGVECPVWVVPEQRFGCY